MKKIQSKKHKIGTYDVNWYYTKYNNHVLIIKDTF